MPVLYLYEDTGCSRRQYDIVAERLPEGPPPGGIFHTAALGEHGRITIVECWESEKAADDWLRIVDAVISEIGAPPRPKPKILKVHALRPEVQAPV